METKQINLCSGLAAGEKVDTILADTSEEFAKGIITRVCMGREISELERENYETLVRTGFEAGVIRQRVDIFRYGEKALTKFIGDWLRENEAKYQTDEDNTADLVLELKIMQLTDDLHTRFAQMFPIVTAK